MAVETERPWHAKPALDKDQSSGGLRAFARTARKGLSTLTSFSSLTRRIVITNLIGLVILIAGMLYLNQFRAGLIEAKMQSLVIQGEIIGQEIAASAAIDTDSARVDPERWLELQSGNGVFAGDEDLGALEFPINPERAAPILRRLIKPTGTRARIYDQDAALLLDSKALTSRGKIVRAELPPPGKDDASAPSQALRWVKRRFLHADLPLYKDIGSENGKAYTEVGIALTGATQKMARVNEKAELVLSVGVPIQRMRRVLGVLLLSTRGGEIDEILSAEWWSIFRISAFAMIVTILLSLALSSTIAGPMRRLSAAATRVRRSIKAREEIPDFTERSDEIGHLSGALRDMTSALYRRIDAIESFAADVSHELKNPLTSLRSATDTLPMAKTKADQTRLIEINPSRCTPT